MTADDHTSTLGARLAAERERRRLTKRELARRIAARVEDQCPTVETLLSYVKRWEAGKSGISGRYRLACAAALGLDPADLFGPAPGAAPPPEPDKGGGPGLNDWGDMERRRLLMATLGLSAFAVAAPLGALVDLAATSEPRDMDAWLITVADQLHALRTRPPAQARDDLTLDLLRLRHQMIQPGADVTELHRILASLAVVYAALLTRLGEHGPALRWWRTASNAADDSGDLDLRVVVRGMAAGCGLYGQRHPSTILLLLDEIRRIGVGSRSLWAVDIKGTRAKALSLLGRHDEARAALRALRSVAPADTPDCPIPTLWLPDQVDFAESWSLAAGGDEQRAGEARERVLATTYDYQYIACAQLHGALCTVVKKGIAEGVGHAAEILDAMSPHYRNQMITETAKHVLAAVPKTDRELPAVRDYREVLATTAPAPHSITN
jgi:transcriptional regulator with XRE-family HTH domain